ncbi:cysteine ABC transporter ATP-binding protein [Thalassobacillus devorans]|uniref:Cysteine ABC transporter ATP-binding protein n=1 Tax=Thalassobacillus devorans TaxID=279813 RepID=A0ABQ1NVJ9_9BACI|nr:thiol reductant ABC exporter subunit CydD [Thalassobacillus devorans]NIK29106.1 ATP-binding cassette subfamily C protein CydD [Thalassobacillus devorans]GGC81122.1 cysteine ABC transporter ATP-binding protein [Thalassobacillus devorans]
MTDLKAIAKQQKKERVMLAMIALLTGTMVIGQAYLFVSVVDSIFLQGLSFSGVLPSLAGLLVVMIARAALTYWSGRTGVKMAANVKADIRRSLLRKYTRNPIQVSFKGQTGQKVSVMLDAVDEIDSYFSQYVPQVIQSSIVPLMIIGTAFYFHTPTGVIMLITAPFIPIFMAIIGMKTKAKSEEKMEEMAAFSGKFLDILQGLTTLKLFGQAGRQQEKIRNSSIKFRDATMEVLKLAFVSSLTLEFISMLSIGIIALEAGLRLIVFDNISFFTAFFVLVLAPEFYTALKDLGSAFHTGRGSMGAADKITKELEEEENIPEWGRQGFTINEPPTISLNDISFRYQENGFSLEDINVELPSNQQIAIAGRSGSGKTTLLYLIAGLITPEKGRIKVDDKQLYDYEEAAWFQQLSYISQHPYLFAGTIADNIAIGIEKEVTRTEVERAAEQAGISGLLHSLEQGLDTAIGEAGRGLSGGEMQRVALARAFLKKPSIILFDEPTTGLDLETERILQHSIEALAKKSTVITVAHRLHTIKNADKILFLDKGRLIAQGSHQELLSSTPAYREMVTAQQGGRSE